MPSPITTPGYRYAKEVYPIDGVTIDFEFNFAGSYIAEEYVTAWIRDTARVETQVAPADIVFVGPNTIRIASIVSADQTSTLIVRRETPKEGPLVVFTDGAILNERNLNKNTKQAVHATAEMVDYFADLLDDFYSINQNVIDAIDLVNIWIPQIQAIVEDYDAMFARVVAAEADIVALDLRADAVELDVLELQSLVADLQADLAGLSITFTGLTDTPNSYVGQAGKVVKVNVGETALEFGTAGVESFLALSEVYDTDPESWKGKRVGFGQDPGDATLVPIQNYPRCVTVVFDGGENDIVAGDFCEVILPYNVRIVNAYKILADAVGSIEVDLLTKANFTAVGSPTSKTNSSPMYLTADDKEERSVITEAWDDPTTWSTDYYWKFEVLSCTGIKKCTIVVEYLEYY